MRGVAEGGGVMLNLVAGVAGLCASAAVAVLHGSVWAVLLCAFLAGLNAGLVVARWQEEG